MVQRSPGWPDLALDAADLMLTFLRESAALKAPTLQERPDARSVFLFVSDCPGPDSLHHHFSARYQFLMKLRCK